ncbi:MAG: hypothetical protein M0Q51_10810 [Bacteroidales bacterium]|nr:hypothetical protein [Bacteroidales bacterium]
MRLLILMRSLYRFALILFLFTGCSLEQKLARSFVEADKPREFLLLRPSIIYKYNLKEFEIPGLDTMEGFRKESMLLENSLFLRAVTDSLLIEQFTAGFGKTLESYNSRVIPGNSIDTLMENGGTPYIINIAQFSLEEYIHPYSSEEEVYDEIIVIDGIDLNAINFNVWLELGRMNTEKKNKVLFVSDYLLDAMGGTLKQSLLSGKMSFDYTIDTITMPQVYEFARRFGKKSAEYLFDYLMNDYIWENIPEDYPYDRYYYHYDPLRNIIYPVGDEERIIELEGY